MTNSNQKGYIRHDKNSSISLGYTHLKHAKLLEGTRRGFFRITQRGIQVLQQNPSRIDYRFLKQFAEYRQFITPRRDKTTSDETAESIVETITSQTPEELLEGSYQSIRQELAQELLSQVKKASPIFFEALVVDLLVKMGYGGSRKDAGERIGKSGDGGIDGIIKEDRLGLDEAHRFAEFIDSKIVLVDGKQLSQYMIDFNVGVSRVSTYEIKKIDTDYFNEV